MLVALRLWLGPAEDMALPSEERDEPAASWSNEPEPWEAEYLARYGTETSIEELIEEGRADELRGLGYRGELPEE